MTPDAYRQLSARFASLHIAVLGDYCLDRYYEIDPARAEISIETGLPVHNVARVRSQPGGAGTVVNNLAALGIGRISALGFCGEEGEGYELRRALAQRPGVTLEHFLSTPLRHTFTYGKPLLMHAGRPPEELSRLDTKNWTVTPADLEDALVAGLEVVLPQVDALIVLDQVDVAHTGVVTSRVLSAIGEAARCRPKLLILADSRRGLRDYPTVSYKMNARELGAITTLAAQPTLAEIFAACVEIARSTARPAFVTLAERGIVGATSDGQVEHSLAWPTRGPIDIVGAGDAVTANLTAALAAGATLADALTIAMAAASIVIHQLGTTGTASPAEIQLMLATADQRQLPAEDPGYSSVRRFLTYTLSLPERTLRSGAGVVGGAVRESAALLVPQAFQDSTTYRVMVRQMLDFMCHDVAGVKGQATADAATPQVENFVARKAVGNFVEMAGMATLHVSPLTLLAIVSDVAYGSQAYLQELAEELKKQGVIDEKSSIHHVDDLLAAVAEASKTTAAAFDTPPLSVEGLRQTIEETRAAVTAIDPAKLIPQSEMQQMWDEMHQLAARENVSLLDISGAATLSMLDKAGKLGRGALSGVKVAGKLLDRHVLDHYWTAMGEIREQGLYATLAQTSEPYIEAVWHNFSSGKSTLTEDLLSGKTLGQAWTSVSRWMGGK